jgi:hypothetical protein
VNQLPSKKQIVVHTSGSVSLDSLNNNNRKGVPTASKLLTKKNKEVDFLSIIPICLESETAPIFDYY